MDKSTFTDVNTLSPMKRNKNSEKNITIYIEIYRNSWNKKSHKRSNNRFIGKFYLDVTLFTPFHTLSKQVIGNFSQDPLQASHKAKNSHSSDEEKKRLRH